MNLQQSLTPIGRVICSRAVTEDDHWDSEEARIELDGDVLAADSVIGLDGFSHIEVIYLLDRVADADIQRGARRPRGNPAWPPVGILAQRAKARPNRLGVTICRLLRVAWPTIEVSGLDAVDGTPVLDIKPVMCAFLPRGPLTEPAWVSELMSEYW